MISKDTYNGTKCVIALNSKMITADGDSRLARGNGLLRSAKRNACDFALDARDLAPEGEDYEGLYLVNDGGGVDLSLQVRRCPWFATLVSSPEGEDGCLIVFPLDTKVYLAFIGSDGDITSDMVVTNMVYKKIVRRFMEESPGCAIYRVPSLGKASKAANAIELGDVGQGYFDLDGTSGVDVFDKTYRLTNLTFLMVKAGYWHPVYFKIIAFGVVCLLATSYYLERQVEINTALKRAAERTKQEQINLFSDHVEWGGSEKISAYAKAYSDLVTEKVQRDALVNLSLEGTLLSAQGLMSVSGGDGVPAQSLYPDNAYRYAQNNPKVTLITGTSRDGWSMDFKTDLAADKRAASGWNERETKRRLIGIARNTFAELTMIGEAVLSTSPNIYELRFSLKLQNSDPARMMRIAEYFRGMPVSVERIKCDFADINKPVACLIVGQAAYLL